MPLFGRVATDRDRCLAVYGSGRLVPLFGRVATDRDRCLAVYGSGRLVPIFGRVATDRDRCLAVYGSGVSPPKIPRTAAQATQALSGLIKFFRQQNHRARREMQFSHLWLKTETEPKKSIRLG